MPFECLDQQLVRRENANNMCQPSLFVVHSTNSLKIEMYDTVFWPFIITFVLYAKYIRFKILLEEHLNSY